METIETIFENYKTQHNEETPNTQEQQAAYDDFACCIDKVFNDENLDEYQRQQLVFDKAVIYARASEKSGFVLGFKMAMNIIQECKR